MSSNRYVLDNPRAQSLPEILFGYRVRELLGEGVGSKVYRVRDAEGAGFALKHVVISDEPALRFFEELKLEHEIAANIGPGSLRKAIVLKTKRAFMVGAVQEAGLILELVKGKSLELVKWPGEAVVLDLFINIANAIKQLHMAGYLHLDIRPSNIIVTERMTAKLIDYGQCCKPGTILPHQKRLPDYVSREQLEGKELTARTDLFLFAWSLYWALCRRNLPIVEKEPDKPLKPGKEMFKTPRNITPPHEVSAKIPVKLSRFIMQCLELKARKRPEHFNEALDVLNEAKAEMGQNGAAVTV